MTRIGKYVILALLMCSFGLPKTLQKKVDKEIKKTFIVESYELRAKNLKMDSSTLLPQRFEPDNLFEIYSENNRLGYAYIGKAPSKTDEFDYMILFDQQWIIKKTKVLIYREDYGGEIGSKRWLRQFDGRSQMDELKLHEDIIAISGATISVKSMTKAVNDVLKSIKILHQKQML